MHGFGMFLDHLLRRKPKKVCSRCGSYYSVDDAVCPQCDGLDDEQLEQLLAAAREMQRVNHWTGIVMLIAAFLVAAFLIGANFWF